MSLSKYFKGIQGEFKHVRWPSQQQTGILTIVIIFVSLATAYFLGAFDWIFSQILGFII